MSRPNDKATAATGVAIVAWLVTSVFYFHQYAMRSAPAVMLPQLESAFHLAAAGVVSLIGLFYYGYAPFSLVAGVAMDQFGPRLTVALGAAAVGAGALLFSTGDVATASVGRFVQGAGGVFALIGAAYIATTHFPASRAATLIGATQMFGMAGGAAGQFAVGPAIAGGLRWDRFWILMGIGAIAIAVAIFIFSPARETAPVARGVQSGTADRLRAAASALRAVFSNPQSVLCGLISGLMFLPTTIFAMVWGVRYLQEAHALPYAAAVLRSASVPCGWIIGCPLLGALSDRIGRRRPVIIGGAAALFIVLYFILFGSRAAFPAYGLGLAAGIASGAAMLPYTVIKEVNRSEFAGTSTGVVNFINFSLSALLGPIFGALLAQASGGGARAHAHYQAAFTPLLVAVGAAIVLALFLKETGPAIMGDRDKTSNSPTAVQRQSSP